MTKIGAGTLDESRANCIDAKFTQSEIACILNASTLQTAMGCATEPPTVVSDVTPPTEPAPAVVDAPPAVATPAPAVATPAPPVVAAATGTVDCKELLHVIKAARSSPPFEEIAGPTIRDGFREAIWDVVPKHRGIVQAANGGSFDVIVANDPVTPPPASITSAYAATVAEVKACLAPPWWEARKPVVDPAHSTVFALDDSGQRVRVEVALLTAPGASRVQLSVYFSH